MGPIETSVNTYIFDPESAPELARLINQDRVVTKAMGGPLSGIFDPDGLRNILDLGSGPGGWCLDCAFLLPDAEVEGVDVSWRMVNYANARALTQRLTNVSFGVVDITQPLDIPDACYDLVNARFLTAVLKRKAWVPFLLECTRVLRPGGYLRLTEGTDFGQTTSEAINQLMDTTRHALYQLGYGFTSDHALSILPALLSFFKQQEFENMTTLAHTLNYSANTEAWSDTHHNIDIISQQMLPTFLNLGLLSEEMFTFLHQQALIDLLSEAFCGIGHMTTIIGQKQRTVPHEVYA
jgi:ubiquinone/menaquinone biosynthesis C-methylase UbiE